MLKQDYLKGQLNDMNDFLQPVVHGFCFWFPMVEAGLHCQSFTFENWISLLECFVPLVPQILLCSAAGCSKLSHRSSQESAMQQASNRNITPESWKQDVQSAVTTRRFCTRNIQSFNLVVHRVIRPRPYHQPDCYLEINCNKWVSSC